MNNLKMPYLHEIDLMLYPTISSETYDLIHFGMNYHCQEHNYCLTTDFTLTLRPQL